LLFTHWGWLNLNGWTNPEPPPAANTHPLDAPGESRDGIALADRERGDHVGLEGIAAIEVATVADGDAGTAPGHGSLAGL
jgi:hypothetical protein